jgi:3'5'-cyclic nucleotide phosphodiesterase/Adenylate and Guanylate cyclase catalytic domain
LDIHTSLILQCSVALFSPPIPTVAASGLPDPQPDHAVAMVKFARHCMHQLQHVVQALDRQLGPGTSELAMRFGIHSGPVTAGVLRGEKSRFQLFGDTVNTAARMETTGAPNKIHLSQQTANLLIAAGKSRWVKARDELVTAKGKGQLQTYWLSFKPPASSSGSVTSGSGKGHQSSQVESRHSATPGNAGLTKVLSEHGDSDASDQEDALMMEPAMPTPTLLKTTLPERSEVVDRSRLVAWNVDVLEGLIQKIVALRTPEEQQEQQRRCQDDGAFDDSQWEVPSTPESTASLLDELQDYIPIPEKPVCYKRDPDSVHLGGRVISQLQDYVEAIASMYNDQNAFHSFGHACHMGQSVKRFLARVAAASAAAQEQDSKSGGATQTDRYGIASDPIAQFACAFVALVHDVDHPGVPNSQLVSEQSELARLYRNKSVAEQNSISVAWELLMEPQFRQLRSCIYTTREDRDRFRQLVVHAAMATDIFDPNLNAQRLSRWERAFPPLADHDATQSADKDKADHNVKAAVIVEHLIQAADVAHTMQHWHMYIKWNERLFRECYQAYLKGRSSSNPADVWYEGELGFLDHYVLPMAQRLKDSLGGAFGVSSEEYLMYAMANRREWELKGKEMIKQYLKNLQ